MGGFEPPTSPSRTVRATNCATSRSKYGSNYSRVFVGEDVGVESLEWGKNGVLLAKADGVQVGIGSGTV